MQGAFVKCEVIMRGIVKKKRYIRWMLVIYDLFIYIAVALLLLILYRGPDQLTNIGVMQQACISFVSIFVVRLIGNIYGQIWRYGGIQCYVKMLCTDAVAFVLYLGLELSLPVEKITFARLLCHAADDLLHQLAVGHDGQHVGVVQLVILVTGEHSGGHVLAELHTGPAQVAHGLAGHPP